jgi:serine/threonine protein kinase/tetratricopeptide (TPR) repeat protein
MNAEAIFHRAVEISDACERASYVAEACRGNPELLAEVQALLKAHEEAGDFLEASPASVTLDQPDKIDGPGTVIGRYQLLELIGEGGMGLVYMAEQKEPVRRRVALKIIKPGMDSKQVIARFEAERQALALMDHPNIAHVFDAGYTEAGRPYFVMELVKGIPITEYCDKNNLSARQRLGLFIDVCKAVQHAHQKGIIHRDIKPSNVMITLHDGKPVPKVIDFGIAKATQQRLTEKTFFTEYHQFIGTPEYMSPEQAELSGLDVDTRTDIYSLGVLLYELLTGTTPFERKQLLSAAYDEIRRIICQTDPPKPSVRLNTLGDALTDVAKHRHVQPGELCRMVRGDLDWVVMKAMEKDRTRRYETANELAADINRHLGDEPVSASPPSVSYRLRKFVRRNRALVTGVAAVLVVLVAGIVVSTIFAVGQARARARAEFHAAMLHGMMESFQSRFFMKSADITVGEAVEMCAKNLELLELREELSDSSPKDFYGVPLPLMVAASRLALGNMYAGLEKYEKAEPQLERAYQFFQKELGWKHEVTRHAMNDLALLYLRQGRYDKAEPLLAKALKASRRIKGDYHDEMLCYSMNDLARRYIQQRQYKEAEPVLVKALEISRRVLGEEHENTLWSMTTLGWVYHEQGRYIEAEPLLVKALKGRRRVLGEEHPSTLYSMNLLGSLYCKQSRYDKAEPLLVKALETSRRVHGEEHEETLWSMTTLGRQYSEQGRCKEAEPLLAKVLEIQRRVLGEEHENTLSSMTSLGWLYFLQGRYNEAEPLLVKALETARRALGEEHPITLDSMHRLGPLYIEQGRYDEAQNLLAKTLEIQRRVLGEENGSTLYSAALIGWLRYKQGQFDEAEALLVKTVETQRRVLGEQDTLFSAKSLGFVYCEQRRYDEAEALLVKGLETSRRVLGEEDLNALHFMNALGLVYVGQGRYDEAEALLAKALEVTRRKFGGEHWRTLETMNDLAVLHREQGRYEEAEDLFREALTGRRRVLGDEHPDTLTSMSDLALLYVKQGRYDEAEPLAIACYQGRSAKFGPEHAFTREAIQVLVRLYDAWGKSQEAQKWRAKLGPGVGPADATKN